MAAEAHPGATYEAGTGRKAEKVVDGLVRVLIV